jgi:hypothetical protein
MLRWRTQATVRTLKRIATAPDTGSLSNSQNEPRTGDREQKMPSVERLIARVPRLDLYYRSAGAVGLARAKAHFELMEKPQKCSQRLRSLGFFTAALLFMSCVHAAVPSTVSISYTPEKIVQPVKGAGAVTVTVNDLRADREKVGNTTGMILKAGNGVITSAESVTVIVKTAMESELRNRGFTLSGGGASVRIDVTQFDVQHVIIRHQNELLLLRRQFPSRSADACGGDRSPRQAYLFAARLRTERFRSEQ